MPRPAYDVLLQSRQRDPVRPEKYGELLLRPIVDNPMNGDGSYQRWEYDHSDKQRFYVGGMVRLRELINIDAQTLSSYSERARTEIRSKTSWPNMPNSGVRWTENCARQQYNHAFNKGRLFFQKAAVIIVSAELALRDAIVAGTLREAKPDLTPEHVYTFMSIIPACWNVDEFNMDYVERVKANTPLFRSDLSRACGQNSTVIDHLSTHFTVDFDTANDIKDHIDRTHPQNPVGDVRARPGRQLGTKGASTNLNLDFG
jgi:hypothetical protein